ncbi:pilus assembly PilX N-terminal domain-containing protein [Marinobacterium sp. xm-a-152]|uniref:pilus assembly PilX N-terminal domain-containing protein n=1 Tax=Marinobacterium sp. xm-a-152 TaxID=2497733 RepID=UPI00156A7147|nr:pilus assembly PilX N-terminal domain-containing protein [Marinobacterium sp. xm-a-152]NRP15272.1 hypothetical protein [Marinobacterium sp. xm-a-152]
MIISHRIQNQKGIATLVTVIVLLMATTITAFTISSSIINEKQVVADEQRAIAAFEAAQSGLSLGVSAFRETMELPSYSERTSGSLDTTGSTWAYWGEFEGDVLKLYAQGDSGDGSVSRIVSAVISYQKLNPPKVPIVAAGGTTLSGNFTIKNNSGNFTIWSGDSVDIGSSGGGTWSSYVPHPSELGTYIESSNKNVRGSDLIENDPALSTLDKTEFEEAFLGSEIVTFCGGEENFIDENDDSTFNGFETFKEAIENAGSVICLKNTKETGTTGVSIPSSTDLGVDQKVIVIDDDWSAGNPPAITGLVFVSGNVDKFNGNGGSFDSPKFKGSLISYGAVDMGNGGINIEFDSNYTNGLGDGASASTLVGSWRDW